MFKINKEFVTGALLGFVAGVASRKIVEELGPSLRPLTKEAIKAAKAAQSRLREGLGYLFETFSDLSAEATADLDLDLLKKKKKKKDARRPAPEAASSAEPAPEAAEAVEVEGVPAGVPDCGTHHSRAEGREATRSVESAVV